MKKIRKPKKKGRIKFDSKAIFMLEVVLKGGKKERGKEGMRERGKEGKKEFGKIGREVIEIKHGENFSFFHFFDWST